MTDGWVVVTLAAIALAGCGHPQSAETVSTPEQGRSADGATRYDGHFTSTDDASRPVPTEPLTP